MNSGERRWANLNPNYKITVQIRNRKRQIDSGDWDRVCFHPWGGNATFGVGLWSNDKHVHPAGSICKYFWKTVLQLPS